MSFTIWLELTVQVHPDKAIHPEYFIPNDQAELERLDLQHTLFLLTLDDDLCLCPKKAGAKRVLDVGTGTGVWAIDFGMSSPFLGSQQVGDKQR